MEKRRATNLILFAVIAALIVLGLSLSPRGEARANFFEDLLKNLRLPFSGRGANTASTTSPVPAAPPQELYKPALDYERAVIGAVKRASPSVVSITISKNVPIIENCPTNPFRGIPPEFRQFFGDQFFEFSEPCERGTELREIGGGSGFTISSDGLILTNKHVVSDRNASYTVFTNDGRKFDAKVLARDPLQDLAIMKINAANLSTVALGDSDSIELGQTAIAIGNALGEFRNTVSVGVISGLSRDVTASGGGSVENIRGVIQTDTAINPGNSGGPLLNLKGEVIGVNTAVVSGAQNIGFAIPINQAKRDIESVKATGEIQVPFLGVRYVIVTPEIAERQKLPIDRGALVRGTEEGPGVIPDSPAAKAGIQAEDIIFEIAGKKITGDQGLAESISTRKVGDTVALKVLRGGKEITLKATLGKRPE